MLTLSITHGDGHEEVFGLPPGLTRVGRDPANDLVLDGGGVSRHHARLLVRDGAVELSDDGSKNGTFFRRRRRHRTREAGGDPWFRLHRDHVGETDAFRALIHVGDEIRVGHFVLAVKPMLSVPLIA